MTKATHQIKSLFRPTVCGVGANHSSKYQVWKQQEQGAERSIDPQHGDETE